MIAIQIPKPRDEQEFERCNVVLWRCILKDETTHLYARRGQRQHGVDILGCRNGDPAHLVGIQCKLKTGRQELKERELREEIAKALTFKPPLSEYVIVTTAPDDAKLHSLASELAIRENKCRQKRIRIAVLGWDNLQLEIQRYPDALTAFYPSHIPQGDKIHHAIDELPEKVSTVLSPKIDMVRQELAALKSSEVAIEYSTVQSEHEKLINDYVALIPDKPETVLELLQRLEVRIGESASDHIRFRVKTNVAACQLELGQESTAANGLIAAWTFAPEDPKAIANRALGYLMLGNWDLVRQLAEEDLKKQPDNERLAACLVRSLIHDEGIDDPMSVIPNETRDSPEVAAAHVQWLMERGEPCSWWDAAISAHRKFPDVPELQELGASALLAKAIGGERYFYGQSFDARGYAGVQAAIQAYEPLWGRVRDGAAKQSGDLSAIPVNLMIAYHIVGNDTAAIDLGWEAHGRFPDEAKITEYLASFLVDQGESGKAAELLSGLADDSQAIIVRFKIAVASKDWTTVSEIVDEHLDQFPEAEQIVARAMSVAAKIELAGAPDVHDVLEGSYRVFEGNSRALACLARAGRDRGIEDVSGIVFDLAIVAFRNGEKSYVDRLAIAEEAAARGQMSIIIEALQGHVERDRDSAELRSLAQALVFDLPVRDRAIEFFENLASEVRGSAFFERLEGILHFNRGVPETSIQPLSAAFEKEPQIDTLLCLVRAYYAIKDFDAIRQLVNNSEVEKLTGSPLDRMNLSHVLLDFSETIRALNAGYGSLIADLENAKLMSRFFGLVLRATSRGLMGIVEGTVGAGVWVRLTDSGGGSYEALVGEAQDRPWGEAVSESNLFISACIGLKVGEEFQITNALDMEEKWTVAEVKPCWLQAFHHLTGSFGQRFPEARGFASLTIVDDDIGPALEQVRRHSAMARQQADVYLQHNIPLIVAAGDRPGGALSFAQYLCSIGEDVKVCIGTADERSEALTVIQEHGRRGAVVDGFTAWHAAVLGALPVLEERLGPLAIPAHELSWLREMIEERLDVGEGDSMSLDYRDGQYIRFVETSSERAERRKAVQALVAAIEEHCSVEPVQLPDNFSEVGEKLVRVPPPGAFNVGVMAGRNRVLVSDDLVIRQWSREGFSAKGTWIQAVLFSAEQAGTMSIDAYAEAVVYLAANRHGYVTVNAPVLFSVFERDQSRDLVQLEALCVYVGGQNAELESNARIVAEFVNTIWANALPIVWADDFPIDSKTRKATNLMLRTLILERREGEWTRWAASLYHGLGTMPRRFLLRWCEENFFSVGQLLSALRRDAE